MVYIRSTRLVSAPIGKKTPRAAGRAWGARENGQSQLLDPAGRPSPDRSSRGILQSYRGLDYPDGRGVLRVLAAAVQADPDPCTGVGVVTCSGNQSLGVLELTPGTTVLNVNSLTSTIAPPVGSGVPGILFFGSGDLTLNSATGPFGLITSDDFVDGIVVQSDGGIKVTSSGNISTTGLVANGINLLSFSGGTISLTSS